jgi:hypothetical protein
VRRLFAAALVAGGMLAGSVSTASSATLLYTFEGGGSGSGRYDFLSSSATSGGMIFKLTYGPQFFDNSNWGLSAPLEIGDPTATFFTGQTGSIDFNSSNSADFLGLTTALSQGGPDIGGFHALIINQSSDPNIDSTGSGGWGNPEAGLALLGTEIDFIRLVVFEVFEDVDPSKEFKISYQTQYEWQFWGEPAVVPIPAALPLLASALGVFGFFGWRRRKAAAA